MAIICRHITSGKQYVVLGAGYGVFQTSHPSVLLGSVQPKKQSGDMQAIAVCDDSGHVSWFKPDDISIESIDGKKPKEILPKKT